ncbi:MAG: hypothetical protein GY784_11130 [Gammaproteobacteria bacterium]|nr:hypothetical protein [Gammaproteobacteria bacterium]
MQSPIYQTIDHMVAKLNPGQVTVELPAGAPFGAVLIDENKCTLCLSCVSSWPGRALQDGSNREDRNRARVLYRDEAFACITCGKPFASSSVIDKLQVFNRKKSQLDELDVETIVTSCSNCRLVIEEVH